MKQINQYIILGGIVLLTACSAPKINDNLAAKQLPENFDLKRKKTSDNLQTFIPLKTETYFKDAKLEDLLKKAIAQNPDYLIMQERILIANSHLKVAKLALLPSLDLVADASGTHYGKYTMDGVGNFDTNFSQNINEKQRINEKVSPNLFLGGKVSWEADIWGKLSNRKKAARERFFASQQGMRLLQTRLLSDVADLYYKLIALDKQAEIYKNNLKTQQKALDIVAAQRSVGKATELAVQQFNAQNNNILAEAEQLNLSIDQTEKALLNLLGEYGGKIERSADFLSGHLEVLNQKISVDSIIHKRPDVSEAYHELRATNADAKAARAAFFPTLNLGGYAGFNSFSFSTFFDNGSFAWQLLGGLTAPVFNKGQIKQEFFVSNKRQEISLLQYQNTITTAYNELSALLHRTESFVGVLQYKSKEIEHLQIAVNVSNDLYLSGYANYLEIINAQKNKLQAELDFVDIQLKNAESQVLLYKALGGGIN
ncbi:Outer membrane protein OprM [Flavobacterium bizetiae]|uniref:Outer membrane protein OprM n=1 Tax=Flavobacterium bizetiae TaxID=2704140 RepID=A0A6J4G738_9FLAO|nr:TolC family protein [Flavobacterium bizetiae]CAA9194813.1 Outer membrane protein OprM [Flavobacterium bizetiae]CAD5343126.1 Outer membrane protein OprM [Flavobacterium bizetiae]CAD5346345.1 Outer membrane protein OprM [Flavobacterium bizetiae]